MDTALGRQGRLLLPVPLIRSGYTEATFLAALRYPAGPESPQVAAEALEGRYARCHKAQTTARYVPQV